MSNVWVQTHELDTVLSTWQSYTINITVAATEKGPELQILHRAPASCGDAQSACDALKVSKIIFHLSTQQPAGIDQSGPPKPVCGWGLCLALVPGAGLQAGATRAPQQVSPAPRIEALGSCLRGLPHTKSSRSGSRAAMPDNYRNRGNSSLISVNYTVEEEDNFSFFNKVHTYS